MVNVVLSNTFLKIKLVCTALTEETGERASIIGDKLQLRTYISNLGVGELYDILPVVDPGFLEMRYICTNVWGLALLIFSHCS